MSPRPVYLVSSSDVAGRQGGVGPAARRRRRPQERRLRGAPLLRETLWDNIKNGQIIEGTVKDTKAFGTLVNLDDETVGLIHTSEMEKLGKKFSPGQDIKVKVLSEDRMSRKIFLTVG